MAIATQLLIFDLDGTLVDSAGDIHRAVDRMLGDLGRSKLPFSAVRGMIGDGAGRLVDRALAETGGTKGPEDHGRALDLFLKHYAAEPVALTATYPHVAETLAALEAPNRKMAVATNKPEGLSRDILDRLGIARFFGTVVGGDTNPYRKPDPRILTDICGVLGCAPKDTILIGDSEVDAATASAAAIPFVLMSYGYRRGPVEAISCWAVLDDFARLTEILPPPPTGSA